MNVGQKIYRFTIIKKLSEGKLICKCDCGNVRTVKAYDLRVNRVKSCGCYKKEGLNYKHGAKKNGKVIMSEYYSWQGMRARCLNPNHSRYEDYGGRGIAICEEWDDFEVFLADMGEKPTKNHSIERLDVDGNYTPENCVWADDVTQARNKRKSSNNKSGFVGVGWNKASRKWRSRINVEGKTILLGYFESKNDAIKARKDAESKYWK